jgi:hypothetical protein
VFARVDKNNNEMAKRVSRDAAHGLMLYVKSLDIRVSICISYVLVPLVRLLIEVFSTVVVCICIVLHRKYYFTYWCPG